MKHGQIVNAHKTLMKLSGQKLSLLAAYNVYKLVNETKKAWNFQIEQEQKLFDELHPVQEEAGLRFKTAEDAQTFNDKMRELYEMESDIEIKPISIRLVEDVTLTPADIETQDGFVEFTE